MFNSFRSSDPSAKNFSSALTLPRRIRSWMQSACIPDPPRNLDSPLLNPPIPPSSASEATACSTDVNAPLPEVAPSDSSSLCCIGEAADLEALSSLSIAESDDHHSCSDDSIEGSVAEAGNTEGTSERNPTDGEIQMGGRGEHEEGNGEIDASGGDGNDDASENVDSLQDLQSLLTTRGRDFGIKVIVMPGVRTPV